MDSCNVCSKFNFQIFQLLYPNIIRVTVMLTYLRAQSTYICWVQSCVWCLPKYWPPHPLLLPASVSSPRTKGVGGGGTHSPFLRVEEGGKGRHPVLLTNIFFNNWAFYYLKGVLRLVQSDRGCAGHVWSHQALHCWSREVKDSWIEDLKERWHDIPLASSYLHRLNL